MGHSVCGLSIYVLFHLFGLWFLGFLLLLQEITQRLWPTQLKTQVAGFDPNIWSVVGPFYVHPSQSGQVQVNPKPNPTRPMDSPRWENYMYGTIVEPIVSMYGFQNVRLLEY